MSSLYPILGYTIIIIFISIIIIIIIIFYNCPTCFAPFLLVERFTLFLSKNTANEKEGLYMSIEVQGAVTIIFFTSFYARSYM